MDTAQVHKMTLENQTVDRMPQQILMDSELELPIKTTKQLVATLLPKDYDIETQLRWKSQYPDVVSVSSTGLVKAVAPGEAEVSVTASNGCSAICLVRVPEPSYHLFLWLKDTIPINFPTNPRLPITMVNWWSTQRWANTLMYKSKYTRLRFQTAVLPLCQGLSPTV